MIAIDLNADVGEGADANADEPIVRLVTSANIACGGHAGTPESMRALVEMALRHGVAIGAHPSYPDRANFGRQGMSISADELQASIASQVGDLISIARACGARVRHVKPHGALYNLAARDAHLAEAIANALVEWREEVTLVGLAGSHALEVWRRLGFRVAAEAFADRRYEPDGSLRARKYADALIADPAEAARQAVSIVTEGRAIAVSGAAVPVSAQTLCVHGDTPNAVPILATIRARLFDHGIAVRCLPGRVA